MGGKVIIMPSDLDFCTESHYIIDTRAHEKLPTPPISTPKAFKIKHETGKARIAYMYTTTMPQNFNPDFDRE
jgi:hypothetical protein